MESPEVRTLVVAELYPWPPVDGYRQRLHHIVGGLSQAGPRRVRPAARPAPNRWRLRGREWSGPPCRWAIPPGPVLDRGLEPLGGALEALSLDWSSSVGALRALAGPIRPDLVLPRRCLVAGASSCSTGARHRRLRQPREPVDAAAAPDPSADRPGAGPVSGPRPWPGGRRRVPSTSSTSVAGGLDPEALCGRVDHVVVCSDLDVERSGAPTVVVPNGAEAPRTPDRPSGAGRCRAVAAVRRCARLRAQHRGDELVPPRRLADRPAGRPDAELRVVGRGRGARFVGGGRRRADAGDRPGPADRARACRRVDRADPGRGRDSPPR